MMGRIKSEQLRSGGFALPTVLIASVVMLMVLLAGLQAVTSASAALRNQYYDKLAKEAADSGFIMATKCLEANAAVVTWSDASPLTSATDCNGNIRSGCPAASDCYLVNNATVRTTFSVGTPTSTGSGALQAAAVGKVEKLRLSSGTVSNTRSVDQAALLSPNKLTWGQVSAKGGDSVCGIGSNDLAYCWGTNNYGQGGNGTTAAGLYKPTAVSTSGVLSGKTIREIGAGSIQTCAIASDNLAYCWGSNTNGGLGNGTTTSSSVPVAVNTAGVLSGKTVKSISSGGGSYGSSCVIASNNLAYCWGANNAGQLGNGNTTSSSVPVAVNTAGVLSGKTIKMISAGPLNACVIASNDLAYCWGDNAWGQLGNGNTTSSSVPVAVSTAGVLSGKTVKSISFGSTHACVIASNNLAYCWGLNGNGELGNGTVTAGSSSPVAVTTTGALAGKTIKAISAGGTHACVIASDDLAYCWGDNSYGQLGNGSTTDSSVAVAVNTAGVLSGKTVKSISAGGDMTCVIASDDNTYCWGEGAWGRLGKSSSNSSVPVAVTPTYGSTYTPLGY